MNFILPFFEGTAAKCTDRIKQTKRPPFFDVPPYAFGQGAVPFVSSVLHYFSAAPRGLYRNHTINNERRELVSREKQGSVLKYRNEYKCIINSLDARILSSRLGNVMQRDKNSMQNGSYLIKSLYFDNYMDAALAEKVNGVDNREKFRIRYYNNDDSYIRLEKKSKKSGLCNKLSCRISKQCCEDILKGDYGKLLDNEEMLAHEFYYKVQYKMLRPKNIVAYDREAFVYEPGNVRITLDSCIRGSNNVMGFLDENQLLINTFKYVILEVKWDEYLPQFIKDLVQLNDRMSAPFSKYAATRLF